MIKSGIQYARRAKRLKPPKGAKVPKTHRQLINALRKSLENMETKDA